jgi:hypothetical protein
MSSYALPQYKDAIAKVLNGNVGEKLKDHPWG